MLHEIHIKILSGTYREQEVEGEEEILYDFHGALHLERHSSRLSHSQIRTVVVSEVSLGRLKTDVTCRLDQSNTSTGATADDI